MTTPRRLFAPTIPELGGPVVLGAGAAHHARVLRLAIGDAVVIFDGRGHEADARLVTIEEGAASCASSPRRASSSSDISHGAGRRVVLVQCLPKGDKLETIVRMTTEIGVAAIALAHGVRSVARPDAKRAATQLERLARIAQEAARQSERTIVPSITAPAALEDAVTRAPANALRLVMLPHTAITLAELAWTVPGAVEIWVVVGPEGGLDRAEIEMLAARGYAPASLGSSTLRVETAAPIAVAIASMVNPLTA